MKLELDPDLRLYSRLLLGRRAKLLAGTFVAAAVAALFWTPSANAFPTDGRGPGLSLIPIVLLLFAPVSVAIRLLDQEARGVMDQIRMCGRAPSRVLATAFFGSMWVPIMLATVMMAVSIRVTHDLEPVGVALLAFGGSTIVALGAYSTLRAAGDFDPRLVAPLLLFACFGMTITVAFAQLSPWPWLPRRPVVAVALLVGLPIVVRMAEQRIARNRPRTSASAPRLLLGTVARLVPRGGPPEFVRQLRCTLRSGGAAAVILFPLFVVVLQRIVPRAAREGVVGSVPFLAILIATVAVGVTLRRDIDDGVFELATLTGQPPIAMVAGACAGAAAVYWAGAAIAFAIAVAMYGERLPSLGWLIAAAAVGPAVAGAEAIQRRRSGSYVALTVCFGMLFLIYSQTRSLVPQALMREAQMAADGRGMFVMARSRLQQLPDAEWRHAVPPFAFDPRVVFGIGLTALAVGAAVGRVRRTSGPAFEGPTAAIAAATIAILAGYIPLLAFGRVVVPLFALVASLFAAEHFSRTLSWRRMTLAPAAAAITLVGVLRFASIGWMGCVTTAGAAGMAMAVGIGIHELAWERPWLSLLLRGSTIPLMQRWTPDAANTVITFFINSRPARPWPDGPMNLTALDLALLTALLAATVAAHILRPAWATPQSPKTR